MSTLKISDSNQEVSYLPQSNFLSSFLDTCLLSAYCIFVFVVLPGLVVSAWSIEAIKVNLEKN